MTSANKADGCIRQKTQDFNKRSVSLLNILIVASWLMEENEFIVYCLLFVVVVVVVVGMEASVPMPAR